VSDITEIDYDHRYTRLHKKQIEGHEKFKGSARYYLAISALEPETGDAARVQYPVLRASLLIVARDSRPDEIEFFQTLVSWVFNNELTIKTNKFKLTWLERIGKAASDYLAPTTTIYIEESGPDELTFRLHVNSFNSDAILRESNLFTRKKPKPEKASARG
jgi:hypothetical protein